MDDQLMFSSSILDPSRNHCKFSSKASASTSSEKCLCIERVSKILKEYNNDKKVYKLTNDTRKDYTYQELLSDYQHIRDRHSEVSEMDHSSHNCEIQKCHTVEGDTSGFNKNKDHISNLLKKIHCFLDHNGIDKEQLKRNAEQKKKLRPSKTSEMKVYSCPFGRQFKDEKWINKHPGGYAHLISAYEVEKDAAHMMFLSYHMGHKIEKVYAMGEKYGYDLPKQTAMHKELMAIFGKVAEEKWIHGIVNQVYVFLLSIFIPSSYIYFFFYPSFFTRFWFNFACLSYGFSIHHTRLHCGKMYDNKVLDGIMKPFYDWLQEIHFMFPVQRWYDVHHKSHHVYTNSEEDNDVWMTYPALYESKNFVVKKFHKWQTFYAPIVFGNLHLTGVIRNVVPRNPITGKLIGSLKNVVLHYMIYCILPYWYHQSFYPVLIYFVYAFIFGCWFAYLFQVSHIQEDCKFFEYKEDKDRDTVGDYDKWVTQQIEGSMSYNNDSHGPNFVCSYIFTLIFGGINCQIEHHVAPGICPMYYMYAADEIKAFAKRHGIYYADRGGFLESIWDYHMFLYNFPRKALKDLEEQKKN